jgi:uncharacterized protein (DUF58 family)
MKTLPTDYIELTREQGEALWWACDAWFDHCSRLLDDVDAVIDHALLAACIIAGNALRASLQTAGVDRTVERFARTDSEAVTQLVTAVVAMDNDFLEADWDQARWATRSDWDEARTQIQRSTTALKEILALIDEAPVH